MKKYKTSIIALLAAGALILGGCSAAQETPESEPAEGESSPPADITASTGASYEYLFSEADVMEINITIDEADWQDMMDNAMAEVYHSASVTVNGITLDNVGVRTKGNSSLMSVSGSDSDRYSFRVKFDKYVEGQTLEGLDEFVLNDGFSDPSYLREYLTYLAMAELGGLTPYLNFCNLYVNGELFGFYLCIEALDDSFVERNSSAADTALYKADGERSTLLSDMELTQFEEKYGSDSALQNIQTLVELLNSESPSKEELESMIDIDSVLTAIAVNTVMGNYDSYSGSMAHNYYLLYSDGKFTYVGWDYNMSIGGFMDEGSQSIIADIETPVYGTSLESRPLFEKLLAIDEYRERYYGYLEQLCEYFSDFENDVATLVALIGDYVKNDPSAFYTYEEFLENTSAGGEDLVAAAQESLANSVSGGDGSAGSGMPEGMEPPTDGQMPDMGNFPGGGEAPEGMEPPEGFNFEDMQEQFGGGGFGGFGGGGDGMMGGTQTSIVDFITARVSVVKGLLDGSYTGETTTGGNFSGFGGGGGFGGFGGGGNFGSESMPGSESSGSADPESPEAA